MEAVIAQSIRSHGLPDEPAHGGRQRLVFSFAALTRCAGQVLEHSGYDCGAVSISANVRSIVVGRAEPFNVQDLRIVLASLGVSFVDAPDAVWRYLETSCLASVLDAQKGRRLKSPNHR